MNLAINHCTAAAPAITTLPNSPRPHPRDTYNEQAVVFGRHQNLVGVYAPADSGSDRCHDDSAVLMLTPGMLGSCGPHRLHRDLAIRLSRNQISSFRFDLSGIGDSVAVGDAKSSLDRAAAEIGAAMDWMGNNHRISRFFLFGLCSGADDAVHVAIDEPRVRGVFAIDGCGFRTPLFYLHRFHRHHLPRLLCRSKWARIARRIVGSGTPTPSSLQLATDIREFPKRNVAADQLLTLANRGIALHFHYTGGVGDYFNHASQFNAMFPELCGYDRVTSTFRPDTDHVAYLTDHRIDLVKLAANQIQRWSEGG